MPRDRDADPPGMPQTPALSTAQRLMATADIFLPGGGYLHLVQACQVGLAWWLVEGARRTRLSVADASRLAPPSMRQEVILEAERLVEIVVRRRDRPDLNTIEWRVAIGALRDSIYDARRQLGGSEHGRDLDRSLADSLAG